MQKLIRLMVFALALTTAGATNGSQVPERGSPSTGSAPNCPYKVAESIVPANQHTSMLPGLTAKSEKLPAMQKGGKTVR